MAASSDLVRRYVLNTQHLVIEDRTAREIVLVVRTSEPFDEDFSMEIGGLSEGDRPGLAVVTRAEVRRVLRQGG